MTKYELVNKERPEVYRYFKTKEEAEEFRKTRIRWNNSEIREVN